ncbi:MAG: tyrosine-type recombinase/integrase [Gemmatimonadaceae bacterium]
MSRLHAAVEDYLTLRRGLGYAAKGTRALLADFVAFLDRNGAEVVSTDLAVAWATAPEGVDPIWWRQRLGTVREFARYLATIDPGTEIPAADLLPAHYNRLTPYLYSEAEIAALMAAGQSLSPPLRAATYTTLIGLLAVTGLRLGEAIALDCGDLKTDTSTLIVGHGKNRSSREIALHHTTVNALGAYRRTVERAIAAPASPSLLVSIRGTRLCPSAVHPTFRAMVQRAGLQPRGARCRPRLHDARHSFAVHTLIRWYEDGTDVDAKLPLLSAFLGHANPASTYWYLQAAPELFSRVAGRLEQLLGEPS